MTSIDVDIRADAQTGAGFTDKPAVRATDPELADLLEEELERQEETLELIPSENLASVAVLEARFSDGISSSVSSWRTSSSSRRSATSGSVARSAGLAVKSAPAGTLGRMSTCVPVTAISAPPWWLLESPREARTTRRR